MAREGTRSATGNSKPRVFTTVDTGPTITRTKKPKTAKPAGVTKKKTTATKPATKAKADAKATERKAVGAAKAIKKKTTPKPKATVK